MDEELKQAAIAGAMAPVMYYALHFLLWCINRTLYWGGYLAGKLARHAGSAARRKQPGSLPRPAKDLLVERVEDSLPDR